MRQPAPYRLDGATAELQPATGRSLAAGPGQVGRGGVQSIAVWCAGTAIWDMDLFATFLEEEALHIEWLSGFLCDEETTAWFDRLANPPEEEEEPEELFAKASMNTLGSENMNDGP